MAKRSYEMDMCNGPLFGNMLRFTFPLILSGILQLMFSAADTVVVGQFVGTTALAAVGSTGPLITLIVNLFIGLSEGANLMASRHYGAKHWEDMERSIHTSMTLSLIIGIALSIVGNIMTVELLKLVGTPHDVLDQATIYMRIYFCALPLSMVYNFASAILRAVGDTRRPLYYLIISGLLNVGLNVLFVVAFHLDVVGVGLATALTQLLSTVLVVRSLLKNDGPCHIELKKLRIYKKELSDIARVGIPTGFQSVIFAFANVVIQSAINSFGSAAIAGNTAASSIESIVVTGVMAFRQAAVTFTSQNLGAHKFDRIDRGIKICTAVVIVIGLVAGGGAYLLGRTLLRIYTSDPEAIEYGMTRLRYTCAPYLVAGVMDVFVGANRGLGAYIVPMIISVLGTCGLRILWIYTALPLNRTFEMLFMPFSLFWLITGAALIIYFFIVKKRVYKAACGSQS